MIGVVRAGRGRAVFVWVVKAELVLIILHRFQCGQFGVCMPTKAARVDHPGVQLCLAMHDLLRQQPAMAAAFAQPGPQPDDAKRIAPAGGDWPDQRRAVDRIGDRAVHHRMDADLGQGRHAGHRALQHIRDPVQIIRAERIGKAGGVDPVHAPPGATVLFIETDQQPVFFLPGIEIADRAANERHAVPGLANGGNVLGQEILVLH